MAPKVKEQANKSEAIAAVESEPTQTAAESTGLTEVSTQEAPIEVAEPVETKQPAKHKAPRLGDSVKVLAAKGLLVRANDQGHYSETESVEVTVNTRIYKLLRDGDLLIAIE